MAFIVPISAFAVGVGAFVFSKMCLYNQSVDDKSINNQSIYDQSFDIKDKQQDLTIIKTDQVARGNIFTPFGIIHPEDDMKNKENIDPVHFFEIMDGHPEYLNCIIWILTTSREDGEIYQYLTLNHESYKKSLEENKAKARAFMGLHKKPQGDALHLEKKSKDTGAAGAAAEIDPSQLTVAQRAKLNEQAQAQSTQTKKRTIKPQHERKRSAFDRILGLFKTQAVNVTNFDLWPIFKPDQKKDIFHIKYKDVKTAPLWKVALSIENDIGKKIFKRLED
jgi:hypothetical protein